MITESERDPNLISQEKTETGKRKSDNNDNSELDLDRHRINRKPIGRKNTRADGIDDQDIIPEDIPDDVWSDFNLSDVNNKKNNDNNMKPTSSSESEKEEPRNELNKAFYETEDENENEAEQEPSEKITHPVELKKYRVCRTRLPREKPPWVPRDNADPPPFQKMKKVEDHPFRYLDNLSFFTITDEVPNTEVIDALYERGYINPTFMNNETKEIGNVMLSPVRKVDVLRLYIKSHLENPVLKSDIKKCLTSLKAIILVNKIKSIGFIRDLAILNDNQWTSFIDMFEEIFKDVKIIATLYKNTLVVPPTDQRYKVIKEYHESTIAGHRGMNATYNKLAKDYYWRNMRPDVQQFVRGCTSCQTKKLTRVKTKQAMLISDTPSRAFEKISIDFYGPINKPSTQGYKYILSVQDWLMKFIVLVPVKCATAEETRKALTDYFIAYFGTPEKLLSDRGSHFMNKVMEEFAKLFKIEKLGTTAFHPQSNGAIERMHHVLAEYLKAYVDRNDNWDEMLPLCMHSYDSTNHEATGYSPHELLFGQKARTPSSFKKSSDENTYDTYLEQMVELLTEMRTIAAMTQVQAKYKSKYYYNKKLNPKYFMEGEMVYVLKEPRKNKYVNQYEGVYEIIGINYKTHNVKLKRGDEIRIVHIDKIKKACVLKTVEMEKRLKAKDKNITEKQIEIESDED